MRERVCVCLCVCVCVDVRKCIIGKCARWVHIIPLQQSHAHTRQSPCNYPGKYIWRCPRRSAMWSAACTGRARTLSSGPWWRRRHAQPLSLLATTVTLAGHLRDVCGRTGQAQDSTGSSQQAHVREGSRTTSSPESISGKSFFFSLSIRKDGISAHTRWPSNTRRPHRRGEQRAAHAFARAGTTGTGAGSAFRGQPGIAVIRPNVRQRRAQDGAAAQEGRRCTQRACACTGQRARPLRVARPRLHAPGQRKPRGTLAHLQHSTRVTTAASARTPACPMQISSGLGSHHCIPASAPLAGR